MGLDHCGVTYLMDFMNRINWCVHSMMKLCVMLACNVRIDSICVYYLWNRPKFAFVGQHVL